MWVFSCSAGSQLLPITSHIGAILHTQAQTNVTSYFHSSNQPLKANMVYATFQALQVEGCITTDHNIPSCVMESTY